MRGERLGAVLAFVPAVLVSGCISRSIATDLGAVRRLAGVAALADIGERDDGSPSSEALELLAMPLDAERAARIALLQDRELRARLEELGIARGRLVQSATLPNPRVEAEVLPERDTRLELAVEYDVSSLVLAPIRARVARAELEASRYEVAAYVVEVGARARAAFFAAAAAQQRLAVAQRALDAFAASRETAEALYAAGNVTALEVAAERAGYERARLDVASLELEVASSRERLRRALGLFGAVAEVEIDLELEVPVFDDDDDSSLERRAIEASLELRAARERVEASARRAGLARVVGRLPDVDLDLHILRGRPENEAGGTSDPELRFGGGVSVAVPLFDRNQGTRRAAEAEVRAGIERYHGLAIEIRSSAREARNRLVAARARLAHLVRTVRPAQLRVLDETRLQYNAMQIDLMRLLAARREQLDVELTYVDALREFHTARAEMDALLAGARVRLDGGTTRVAFGAPTTDEGGH